MPSHELVDSETGIIIPKMVFWGLIMPLLCALVGGTWWMATLSQTITNQSATQIAISARIADVERTVQANKDLSASSAGIISDRLTRMEAQLSFLVNTAGPHK